MKKYYTIKKANQSPPLWWREPGRGGGFWIGIPTQYEYGDLPTVIQGARLTTDERDGLRYVTDDGRTLAVVEVTG